VLLNRPGAFALLLLTTLTLISCRGVQPITNAVPCDGLQSVRDQSLLTLPLHVRQPLASNNANIERFCE
jgi:hypothetical protein